MLLKVFLITNKKFQFQIKNKRVKWKFLATFYRVSDFLEFFNVLIRSNVIFEYSDNTTTVDKYFNVNS